ncbi:MAG TPA: hypothetical protein PK264_19935 [Hyphomicrobiaceae bacterium]|nr:hypothetical protein [Hyphomicrobiaceae bacterium]
MRSQLFRWSTLAAGLVVLLPVTAGAVGKAPEIRTHAGNPVPECVSPRRLMLFLKERNPGLDPVYEDIAKLYKAHGDANRVRWDYAFYQMLIETNYLSYRRGSGWGDAKPKQFNFAGLGTTGRGVPGEAFPDVSTGVLAQIQHLVAYAGDKVENPVAKRTRDNQDGIIAISRRLGRTVTWADLTRRWAMDRRYWTMIESIADRFRTAHCHGVDEQDETRVVAKAPPRPEPARRKAAKSAAPVTPAPTAAPSPQPASILPNPAAHARSSLGGPLPGPAPTPAASPSAACRIFTASYGGTRNALISVSIGGETHLTALQVLDGQEQALADAFIADHARGGELLGVFESRSDAISRARVICPAAVPPTRG